MDWAGVYTEMHEIFDIFVFFTDYDEMMHKNTLICITKPMGKMLKPVVGMRK